MSRDKSYGRDTCGHSVKKEQDECGCGCGHDHGGRDRSKKSMILKYSIGAIPLIVAFLPFVPFPIRITFAIAVYAVFGFEVWREMMEGFIDGRVFTEFTLMCTATVCAFLIGEYADAAAVVYLYSLGEYLSGQALLGSKKKISELFELTPEYATILKNGELMRVSPDRVSVGEIVVVSAGERVPVDGRVLEGGADADVSSVTGESTPLALCQGAVCPSGALVLNGGVRLEAIADYENSAVAKMTRAVEMAAKRKSKAERLISRFARSFTPIAFAVAVLIAVLGSLITGDTALWIRAGISVLVISCPCALLLSVPLTYFAGIGAAASRGIVFRGGEVMDALSKVRCAVFDKTGTLTDSEPTPCGIEIFGNMKREEFLFLASDILSYSPHVAALSFCRAFPPRKSLRVEDVENIGGRGIVCRADGRRMLFGNAALMRENGIDVADSKTTAIFGACEGELLGRIDFVSASRKEAHKMISELKDLGVERMAIISGDAETSVSGTSRELGINEFYYSVAPDEKVRILQEIMDGEGAKSSKGKTLYCGDGLNDSAVIKLADVGVSIGERGSALTVEQADVVLMDGGVERLGETIKISKRVAKIAAQNIVISLGVKLAVLIIGVLLSAMGRQMPLELAVIADVGATLLAVLNAVRASKGVKK